MLAVERALAELVQLPGAGGLIFVQELARDVEEHARRQGRSLPAPCRLERDAAGEDLQHLALAAVLCARCATLPTFGQSPDTPDPERLQRLAQGEVAAVVGRGPVERALRSALLPAALGAEDSEGLRRAGADLARAAAELRASSGYWERDLHAWGELREAVVIEWLGEEEDRWRGGAHRLLLRRQTPMSLLGLQSFLSMGLASVGVVVGAALYSVLPSPWAVSKAGLTISALLAWFALANCGHALTGRLFRWRYRYAWLDPVQRSLELQDSGHHGAMDPPHVFRLDALQSSRHWWGGILLSFGRPWWRRLLDPAYVPTPTPAEASQLERFLAGELDEELLRGASRVPGLLGLRGLPPHPRRQP